MFYELYEKFWENKNTSNNKAASMVVKLTLVITQCLSLPDRHIYTRQTERQTEKWASKQFLCEN